ncbi:hypothetical protein ANN_09281 [Periplaneta americana]|uniref:Uncharacterized protein n=1 Tax=Periplaneta americana TaxID=6978 RepID=A0ABQ8TMP2_PERAM|nr:hypothetical protein ANN_09281 [Periplaneta americana]
MDGLCEGVNEPTGSLKAICKRCRREFEHRFAGVRIPSRSTIHDLSLKSDVPTGFFLNKKRVQQRRVLTEEKFDEVGVRLEHSPRKSLRRLGQEFNIFKTSAFVVTKLLKLKPYRVTVVHALQPQDPVAVKMMICRCELVKARSKNPERRILPPLCRFRYNCRIDKVKGFETLPKKVLEMQAKKI